MNECYFESVFEMHNRRVSKPSTLLGVKCLRRLQFFVRILPVSYELESLSL